MLEQLQSLKFATIANALVTHEDLLPEDDIGWLDPINDIPSDFGGYMDCNRQQTYFRLNYSILEGGHELLV